METILLVFRWLIRRDLPTFLKFIELAEEDAIIILRQRNCISVVLERNFPHCDPVIVGGAIYELEKESIRVLHFGCAADADGHFYSELVQRLVDKLSEQRRKRVDFVVPEHCVHQQIRLAGCGCIGNQTHGSTDVIMSYYL